MAIVWLLIVGAAAGFLATRFMKIELDLISTVVVGMIGALIGGLLLQVASGLLGALGGLVGAILGAMLVIWVWQKLKSR